MTINKDNYELYLIDYFDGNLSGTMKLEVEQFLALNPDIREEFECFSEANASVPEINFNAKDQLKKIPFAKSDAKSEFFQQQCVAKIENLLNKSEIVAFNEAIQSDESKQREFDIFSKTKLKPEHLIFNEKLILKQTDFLHVINPDNFEEYCVACSEGWLNHDGMVALNDYLKENPNLQKDYELYSKLKLVPDFAIKYNSKDTLKKFWILPLNATRSISIAASAAAILLFSYFIINNANISKQMNSVATLQTIEQPKTVKQPEVTNHTESVKKKITRTEPVVIAQNNTEQKKNIDTQQKENSVKRHDELENINPKTINNIECEKCTENEIEINECYIELKQKQNNIVAEQKQMENKSHLTAKNIFAKIFIASCKGAEHLTNGKIRVKENDSKQKTTVGFNSRFLAFSTNIKTNEKAN